MTTPFVLVDGSSYIYRAFHAMPPLTNPQGEPTGAVYGVINMLRKLLHEINPTHIAVVFDAKEKTFRSEIYPEYKAHRPPMPPELVAQIEPIHSIIKAMGIPVLCISGVEADDVIGTLAKQAEQHQMYTLISTGDKDMAQLVSPHIHLVNTMTESELDPVRVEEKFGVKPEQIIDLLTLMGDTSDNVPGVEKVGPKTAAKWLQEYKSLDNLFAHADNIKGKIGENLRAAIPRLPISKQLVTIKCDVKLDFTPEQLTRTTADNETLKNWFERLAFKGWLLELNQQGGHTVAPEMPTEKTAKKYDLVLTEHDLDNWLNKISAAKVFAIDTETTDLNMINAQIVGISLAVSAHEGAYIPFAHDYLDAPKQLSEATVLQKLKPILEDPLKPKVGQNLKYDINTFINHGIELRGVTYDTMLESYVYNPTAVRHNLDAMALKYLNHHTITFEDVAGKGAKQLTFNQVDLDKACEYAAEDAEVCLQLHETLWPKISADPKLQEVFESIEMPLVPVLARIERTGVLVDAELLRAQSKDLEQRIHILQNEIYAFAGETFNIDSPKQLQAILFDKLKLPTTAKTPTGQASTSEAVLQELAHDYPLPKLILEYRSLSKLKSTYTDKLPEQIQGKTGRIHTSYHQAVTATGRLSSSDPNLQNIPVRTEEGRKIRQAFIAPPGYKIVAIDYSQIELRIMAHLADDPGLQKAFRHGLDIHSATAAEVFNLKPEEVTPLHRRNAKAINFGLIYGMSAFGLAKQLDISRHEAKEYIDTYFHRYPKVKEYMENTRNLAHNQGYVETFFGRRLYLPEINSRNAMQRTAAERAAINAPLQGTAADIIKQAMIIIDHYFLAEKIDARMIMQVHDELVFEVKTELVETLTPILISKMAKAANLGVELLAHAGVGDNWDEAH
ncbi:MAG: DNA polymerase I [Gammaproteobacteria bacterium]|jgi:DNA polymerase-1